MWGYVQTVWDKSDVVQAEEPGGQPPPEERWGDRASLRACRRNPPCPHLEFGHPSPGSPQSTPRPSVWGICLEPVKPLDPSSLLPQHPLSCLHILLFQADRVLTSQNLMLVFAAFSPCGFAVNTQGEKEVKTPLLFYFKTKVSIDFLFSFFETSSYQLITS